MPSRAWASANRYSHQWRKLRKLVLDRDGYACQHRGRRCLGRADQVHHKLGIAVSGLLCDPSLLAAVCQPCNREIGEPDSVDPCPTPATRW